MLQAPRTTGILRNGCLFGSWSSEVPRVSSSLLPLETKLARELEGEVNHPNRSTLPSTRGPTVAVTDPVLSVGHPSRQPCCAPRELQAEDSGTYGGVGARGNEIKLSSLLRKGLLPDT